MSAYPLCGRLMTRSRCIPVVGPRWDHGRMTAWQDVEQAEPEFAHRVRLLHDLQADRSP